AAVNRNYGQHDHHTGADSPGFHRDSANSGDDQDTGEVQTVEPLAGSHGRSFGTGNREQGTGNREQGTGNKKRGSIAAPSFLSPFICPGGYAAPSILVGVTLTRSPGCST